MQNLPTTSASPAQAANTLVYPFKIKIEPGRVRGRVSDFRERELVITPAGIHLEGKALMALWKRVLFSCLGLVLLYGALAVAVVVNHLIRFPSSLALAWEDVEEIVLESRKNRACVVYRQPEDPKRVYSLAFYLPPAMFQYFSEVVRYFCKERVREGKVGPAESPWVGIAILLVLLLFLALVLVFADR